MKTTTTMFEVMLPMSANQQTGGPTSAWGWGAAPEKAWGWGGYSDTEIII